MYVSVGALVAVRTFGLLCAVLMAGIAQTTAARTKKWIAGFTASSPTDKIIQAQGARSVGFDAFTLRRLKDESVVNPG